MIASATKVTLTHKGLPEIVWTTVYEKPDCSWCKHKTAGIGFHHSFKTAPLHRLYIPQNFFLRSSWILSDTYCISFVWHISWVIHFNCTILLPTMYWWHFGYNLPLTVHPFRFMTRSLFIGYVLDLANHWLCLNLLHSLVIWLFRTNAPPLDLHMSLQKPSILSRGHAGMSKSGHTPDCKISFRSTTAIWCQSLPD